MASRIIITGGGTGGHIYPALGVAEALRGEAVEFVGTAQGPEARIVPAAGYRFHAIPSRKLDGRPGLATLVALGTAAGGVVRAARLLRDLRPGVVFGTGGYAAAPVLLAASLLRVPTLIHEGNSIPGRTNRWLARVATRVAVSYEASLPFFPTGKTIVTGFPVRAAIAGGSAERARSALGLGARPLIFAFGGSTGSASINRAMDEALPLLTPLGIEALHQRGRMDAEGDDTARASRPGWYHPVRYVEEMPDALAAAELVISRAGASTLAELATAGRPAILVPYPHAHADHQTANARALVEAGAAVLLPDAELTGPRLASEITRLMQDPGRRQRMASAARALARPDAAARIAAEIRQLATARRSYPGRERRAA